MRAALHTAVNSGAVEDGLWLAVAMSTLWFVRGAYGEARSWLSQLLALAGSETAPLARAHALTGAGHFASLQSEYGSRIASARGGHAGSEAGPSTPRWRGSSFQGNVARQRADLDAAHAAYTEALAHYRSDGHPMWQATVLAHLDSSCTNRVTYPRRRSTPRRAWSFRASGQHLGRVACMRVRGASPHNNVSGPRPNVARDKRGAGPGARRRSRQVHSALAIADDIHSAADTPLAWQTYHQSLVLADRAGHTLLVARSLEGLARLAAPNAPVRAVHLAAAADALRSGAGVRMQAVERERLDASMHVALSALGAAGFTAAWNVGRRMDVAELIAAARETES